jgi:hypothetical protein
MSSLIFPPSAIVSFEMFLIRIFCHTLQMEHLKAIVGFGIVAANNWDIGQQKMVWKALM